MSREFQDRDFRTWEAYPSPGQPAASDRTRLIFYCLTDPALRARYLDHPGDPSEAEEFLSSQSEAALTELLEESAELK